MKYFVIAVVIAGTMAWGQSTEEFEMTVRAGTRSAGNGQGGECQVRVRIDNRAYVEVMWNRLRVRTLEGSPSFNDGSYCNAPMPMNPTGFNFRAGSGRGSMRLEQRPSSSNNGVMRVLIEDRDAGEGTYTFNLSWRGGSGGSGGGWGPIGPGWPGGGGPGGGGPGGNWSGSGRGEFSVPASVSNASLEVNGGRGTLRLRTGNGEIELSGRVGRSSGSRIELDVNDCRGAGMNNCNGQATIETNGRQIRSATASGNAASGRFSLSFRN